jgi:glycosyltransferase involved in cell wall biosynthesis
MATVSILLPVKDESRYINDCLNSIQGQSYSEWEVALVDDHSTDDTLTIARQFESADPRFRCISNAGKGLVDALQTGLQAINSKFVTRMDGDDLMPPNRLYDMLKVAESSDDQTVVTGYVSYFGESPISKGYKSYERWLNDRQRKDDYWKHIYRECVVASPNWMMSTEQLKSIGGYDDIMYPEDYSMVLKWYQHNLKVVSTHTQTLLWREHPERMSRHHDGYSQHAFFEMKMNAFILNENLSRPLVIWGDNQKSKLAKKILSRHNIAYTLMDLTSFREIEKVDNPILLLAIYPGANERSKIESYLQTLQMHMGRDYWYL